MKDMSDKYGRFYDKRINLKLTQSSKEALMKLLEKEPPARSAGAKLSHISKVDGIKMVFDDKSWILARASGTEPMIRTYYENTSESKLKYMISDFESFVSSVIGV